MFLLDGQFVFSPSDVTAAVACEFALLRGLDVMLGRLPAAEAKTDAMLDRTARLGEAHEARGLRQYIAEFGEYNAEAHAGVYLVGRPARERAAFTAAATETASVLTAGADVVYQAAFFRNGLSGFADFIVRQPGGAYAIYDSKLARHAKVSALLQLAAYADELTALQIPLAPQVHLLLGDGSTSSHDVADIIPVYRERRRRLEQIVDVHMNSDGSVMWNDSRFIACGRCDTCIAEVEAHRDLLMVAGLRTSQRTRLIEQGVTTIDGLAERLDPIAGMRARTYESLHAQAAMQLKQPGAHDPVVADVFDPAALAVIPEPNPGDIFFDFEGDPLWSDGDPTMSGLEYLFGVVEVDTGEPVFHPFWAHDRAAEKQALLDFLDYVVQRRRRYPGLHIYHYAAYEKSALLRLAGRYGVGEAIIDDLLRDAVLVDLYSVVRNSVRISQPSYSLKKLEPLYMGADLRESEVTNASDSIVAYAYYCNLVAEQDSAAAETQLAEIADYNLYDCVSTWQLRDWLLDRAAEHGVSLVGPLIETPAEAPQDDEALLVERLMSFAGERPRRPEQEAIALLAASIGYHQRELKPFWWAHFDRLIKPVDEWADTGEVFIIDDAEVVSPWSRTGKQRNDRRTLLLRGTLGVGAQLGPGNSVKALYTADSVPDGFEAMPGQRGVSGSVKIVDRGIDEQGRDVLEVEEVAPTGVPSFAELPMALVPGDPVRMDNLHKAILGLATKVADQLDAGMAAESVLAQQPSLQLLALYAPRLRGDSTLPEVANDDYMTALTEAVRRLDGSYLAVQGPPGSGKTFVGSHVIAALVREGWRIGVVAQSHKVIENVLRAVSAAGVGADLIAKKPSGQPNPNDPWTQLSKDQEFGQFMTDHEGCVIGGTAWDFTNRNRIDVDSLDLLVIDEAGQFSLANTIAVSVAAKRLLLLGDPQQLPQVSQGTHPEPCDDSALEWVIEGHRVMPAERGYFLAITWRMHPELTARVSRLAYDNELKSNADVTAARELDGIEPGLQVREVEHIGNSVESPEEAAAVLSAVAELLGRDWTDEHGTRPLGEADILVVAPYNAQVALIRRRLDEAGYAGVNVGSVDKFQGQEAPVVIVSMTASAPEDVPRGMDFLLSRNRVNVAISRGQWCAILIRSPRLTDYLPPQPTGLSRLGAFIGLCS